MYNRQHKTPTKNQTELQEHAPEQEITLPKKQQQFYTQNYQETPHPRRGILLFGPNRSKHVYPLYRDSEIGIDDRFQNIVHTTFNDDDRMTTSTQLGLAMSQTCQDLYDRLAGKMSSQGESSFASHNLQEGDQ